ncbi:MAG: lipopolysaccharide biosynthesis protein [Candidatus Cyclobacteriaceae bacterium M3_2C_046]
MGTTQTESIPDKIKSFYKKGNWAYWSKILSKFLSIQVLIKGLGFLITFGLIRLLTKEEYALFTISTSLFAIIQVLSDSGVGSGISMIGGKVWNDKNKLGQLIKTAIHLRRLIFIPSAIVVGPIAFGLLSKNNASLTEGVVLTLLIVMIASFQIDINISKSVLKFHSKFDSIQKLELANTILKIIVFASLGFIYLNVTIVLATVALGFLLEKLLSEKWSQKHIEKIKEVNNEYKGKIVNIVKDQLPNSIFFALRSQLDVFLISIFGNVESIAELGALSKISMIFTIFMITFNSVVVPNYAKTLNKSELIRKIIMISIIFFSACAAFLASVMIMPDLFLFLLGDGYQNLESELVLLIVLMILRQYTTVLFALNSAKGKVPKWWLNISISVASVVLALIFFDISTVKGVILFNIFSLLPTLGYFGYIKFNLLKNYST